MSSRQYRVLLDEKTGDTRQLPSVTTIVGMIHSYALERYKLRLVAELARTAPLDWTPDRILSAALDEGGAAAKAGTRQHELSEMIQGGTPGNISKSEASMVGLIRSFFDTYGLEVLATEMAVASLRYGWAGRLDRIVRLTRDLGEGLPAGMVLPLDIKSGKAVQAEVAMQLRCYAEADTALVSTGDLFEMHPLPDWWGEVSTDVGLVAHLRLDGTQALIPVGLSGQMGHEVGGIDPLSMAMRCRRIWDWEKYERPHLLGHPIPAPATAPTPEQTEEQMIADLEAAFPGLEVRDEMEHYKLELWGWLQAITMAAAEHNPECLTRIAANWPAACPSFRDVRKGTTPIPALQVQQQAEMVISDSMKRFQTPFPSKERPLPPRGASIEEVPESIIAVDHPHPLDVEEFRVEWERVHLLLNPKKRVPSMPSISTRRTLDDYRRRLVKFEADSREEVDA